MALLTPQQVQIAGTELTYGAASASDTARPDERTFLLVKNTGTSDTVTIVTPGLVYGQAIPDLTVTVPATTGERLIGPLVSGLADPSTGLITINHSQTTGVTCALVRI